ncbi:MAG: serine/threonine protein kinase [Candidatus Thermoplasmatota archaeon]|nr:serine/threonine protein kinase [Candidatus Thermoplasmatota archaeon]
MDRGSIRKTLFYAAFIFVVAVILLYISGYYTGFNPLSYFVPYSLVITASIILVFSVWFVLILVGNRRYPDENKAKPSTGSLLMLVFFMFVTSFVSIYYVISKIGRPWDLTVLIPLVPLYTYSDFRRRKTKLRKNARKKDPRNPVQDIVSILMAGSLGFFIYMGKPFILYIALLLAALSFMSMAGKSRTYSSFRYMSSRIVIPFSAAFMLTDFSLYYGAIKSSGILLVPIVIIAFLISSAIIVTFRRRPLFYYLGMLLMFATSVLGILDLMRYYSSYPMSFLTLTGVVAYILALSGDDAMDDNHNIANSFRLFKNSSVYFSAVLVVVLFGLLYFFRFFDINVRGSDGLAYVSAYLSNSFRYTILDTLGTTALLIMALLAVSVLIGSRKINVILFALMILLFGYGLYSAVSLKDPGVWDINSIYAISITVIVGAAVFYEPSFRFMRSYSSRISRKYSISYQMGTARYLRGRFDVDTTVDKSKNKDFLGAGGFAYVFKGKDTLTNRDVVIKVPRVFDEESKTERERKLHMQESVRQLYEESKILSQISYPGIVGLVDYFKEGDQYYLVEEYADGKNMSSYLGDNIKNGTPLDEANSIRLALSLLFSVNYMHMHEIYHRDLNPGNIVLTKSGPKIIDFGTSKNLSMRVSTAFFTHSQRIGVPCYHPPELDIEDKINISAAYDTYSVGALICSMLTGQFLDSSEMKKNYGYEYITEDYLQREIRPRASDWFYRIISKTLSFKADDRYQSAFEMIADIMGLKGNYIVTDMGFIYPMEHGSSYDVILSSEYKVPHVGSNVVRTKTVELYENGKFNNVSVGKIGVIGMENNFKLETTGKRAFYIKAIGSYPEKRNEVTLVPRVIYSFRQDLRYANFSFYTVR